MKKIKFLFLLVCCYKFVWGNHLPGTMQTENQKLYQELKLEGIIGFPAFQQAIAGYNKFSGNKKNHLLALIDFTKPSTEKRFCVIDLKQKKILFPSYVAHGRGSGEKYAVSFSNQPGSYKSSLGFYRTGNTYSGKNGYSLLLDGLEKGVNDKARERAIVIHGAAYADPTVLNTQNRLGRSLGCPALPPAISRQVIDTIKEGALLYIHGINNPHFYSSSLSG